LLTTSGSYLVPDGFPILLDENIPYPVVTGLRDALPNSEIWHALDVGLEGRRDEDVLGWAMARRALTQAPDFG
jgi:hypothetical protein